MNDPILGTRYLVTATTGGNPALEPLEGSSHSLGFMYSSQLVPNLQVGATYWSVTEQNAISGFSAQFVVANEGVFPGRVVRDATGRITTVDATRVNFGSIDVTGVDYQLNYLYPSSIGDWSTSLNATQVLTYDTALTPSSPIVDGNGKARDSGLWSPTWKFAASLNWKTENFSTTAIARYVSEYQDYSSTRRIGDTWFFDTNFRVELGKAIVSDNQFVAGTFVELGAVNVFDELPEFSNFGGGFYGYDPAQADIQGRFVYLRVGTKL